MKTKNWVIAGLLTAGGMIAGAGIEVQAKENKEVFDLPDEDQFLAETSESAVMWYYVKKTDTDLRASGDSTSYTKDFLRFLP